VTGEEWVERALCREVDPELFYPEAVGASARNFMYRQAVKVCQSCDVRQECYEFARDNNEQHGVWGGHYAWQIQRAAKRKESA
jgi:WhiB family redox-sensing transcriptional regulator